MAITYTLGSLPKWIIINNVGTTAGGAKMFTWSSLNKTFPKAVYTDPAGAVPWTNPVIFDLNGTQGPFYWQFDDTLTDDLYYIEVYDSDDNLLWTIDDFTGDTGSGGGGGGTTYVDTKNFIINGLFWRYYSNDFFVSNTTNFVIAPGAHAALPEVSTSTNGATGSDIRFIKSNTTSTDRIRFVNFLQGSDPFTNDVTPAWSLRFTCSAAGSETYKFLQFPITQNVNQIDNQPMTFVCWAKTETGVATVPVDFRQFYGSSAGGADTVSVAQNMSLTTTWTRFVLNINVPTASGAIGACGNDALYLRINLPVGTTDLYIAKPQLYLGTISPEAEITAFDEIDSIINAPRTGDIQTSIRSAPPYGWVAMDDQTIGSAASSATNRNNIDTFPLYREIYMNVSDSFAPVTGGRTAPGNTINTCITDFAANKPIALTKALGRVFAGNNYAFTSNITFTADMTTDELTVASTATLPTGTPVFVSNSGGALPTPLLANTIYYTISLTGTTLYLAASADDAAAGTQIDITANGTGTQTLVPTMGATYGEGNHVLTVAEMPAHNHPGSVVPHPTQNIFGGGASSGYNTALGGSSGITIASQGGGGGHNTIQPTTFMNVFIKL